MPGKSPSVNFYPISDREPEAHLVIACRLVEKVVGLGYRVHVHAADQQQANRIDEMLWTLRAESFLPHAILASKDEQSPADLPVTIGFAQLSPQNKDVLINLAQQVHEQHAAFSKISDLVAADAANLQSGRLRYRFYQSQGYQLETHKL